MSILESDEDRLLELLKLNIRVVFNVGGYSPKIVIQAYDLILDGIWGDDAYTVKMDFKKNISTQRR